MNLISNTKYKVPYNGEEAFGYRLTNIKNKKWYVGRSNQDINTYVTSSRNVELLKAISAGEIEREILIVGNSEDIESWEKEYLINNDATKNPLSYNGNNGISNLDRLPNVNSMKNVAQSIIDNHSIGGVDAQWVEIDKIIDVNGRGKLKEHDPLNSLDHIQVREDKLMSDHVKRLRDLIDESHGQFNAIGQDFLIVILEDRIWNNKRGDKLIGGAHTLEAIITSTYAHKARILRIPNHIHSAWNDVEIRTLGLQLNPRDKVIKTSTSLDDLVKNMVDMNLYHGVKLDSTTMKDLKNTICNTRSEKDWVTKKVKKLVEEHLEKNRNYIPSNIIDYTDPKEFKVIENKIKTLSKDKSVFAKSFTTGKANVFDYAATILHNIYHPKGKNTRIKTFYAIIWHPDRKRKETWEKKYLPGFKDLKRCLKDGVNVDLILDEMDLERKEV